MIASRLFRGQEALAALDPSERGLAYGDGLFETMRVSRGQLPWWPAHLARLAQGAAALGIPLPPADWLAAQARALAAEAPVQAVLKLVLTRGSGGRGYAPPAEPVPTVQLSLHPFPAPPASPLVLHLCRTRLSLQPALAGIKHLNRLDQVLARAECPAAGSDEGLMLDAGGRLACATAANLFLRLDGRWLTPDLQGGGVAGLARAWLLRNLPDTGTATLAPDRLADAEALFLCNAVRGILPVGRVGDRVLAACADVDALRARLERALAAPQEE